MTFHTADTRDDAAYGAFGEPLLTRRILCDKKDTIEFLDAFQGVDKVKDKPL